MVLGPQLRTTRGQSPQQAREARGQPVGGAWPLSSASLHAGLPEKWPSPPRPVPVTLPPLEE